MPSLRPAKGSRPNKYSRFTPPSGELDMVDLGGWTLPSWSGRPHMGPGNKVMDTKSPYYGDEKYRQHDLGYSDITNSYMNYNPADEMLLRSPTEGPADYVGKGVFIAKKALDVFNTPSLYKGGYGAKKKDVNSKKDYQYIKDFESYIASSAPSSNVSRKRDYGTYFSSTSSTPGASGPRRKDFGWYDRTGRSPYSEVDQYVDQPSSGSSGGGGARGGSGRKHDYKVKYDYS